MSRMTVIDPEVAPFEASRGFPLFSCSNFGFFLVFYEILFEFLVWGFSISFLLIYSWLSFLVEDTSSLSLEGPLSRVNEALVAQNFPWLFSLVRSSAAHLQFLLVLEVVLQTRLWRLWAQGNAFSAFLGSWF